MDVLDYMLPDQVWALSHHLECDAHPMFVKVVGNQIWYMKGRSGFPWDMNTFDDLAVYQSITELDWENADRFKIFASDSWANANGGVAWAPRQYEEGLGGPIVTPDSTYRLHSNCSDYKEQNLGAPISITVEGPYGFDFGGDLGHKPCLVQRYFWGPDQANMELNRYVRGFGWAQWELWQLSGTIYVRKQFSAFNRIAAGGSPDPLFPCGVPVITKKSRRT
jgi:hypothetical protein